MRTMFRFLDRDSIWIYMDRLSYGFFVISLLLFVHMLVG
jgi:hypothetical protein